MIVTPKEIDKVVQDLARIIADALNIALHKTSRWRKRGVTCTKLTALIYKLIALHRFE